MTNSEFSNAFDTLINAFKHKAEYGDVSSLADVSFDEYEKSLFLTQAQDNIVRSYFYRNTNAAGQGIDDSNRRQLDFSSLIKVKEISRSTGITSFDDRGIIFKLPSKVGSMGNTVPNTTDVLYILNEVLIATKDTKSNRYVLVPLNYNEYNRLMSKAYSEPLKKQAWRLFQNQEMHFDIQSEVIPRTELVTNQYQFKYKLRYVSRPNPIILLDLPKGLTIDGVNKETECTLNPSLHLDILNEAVRLALVSNGIETQDKKAARQQQQQQNK